MSSFWQSRLLLLIGLLMLVLTPAQAQSHTFPALDTNNTWTGNNIFANVQLSTLTPSSQVCTDVSKNLSTLNCVSAYTELGANALIANGNFELPKFNYTLNTISSASPPYGWFSILPDTGTMAWDATTSPSNEIFSLHIHCNANGIECEATNLQFTNVLPGQTYTATAWAKSDGTAPAALCIEYASDGLSMVQTQTVCSMTTSTSWTFLTTTSTVNMAGQNFMLVNLSDSPNTTGTSAGQDPIAGDIWWQDIQAFTNYVTGPLTVSGAVSGATYSTATNCASSASPAVCGSAASGSVTVAAAATTKVVDTSAVTASSQIQLTFDSSLGTALSVTCNTTPVQPTVSARTAATSFTITVPSAPSSNPACFSYTIIN